MKWHPILFRGPMVKAILEGRKTQTRRIIKTQPGQGWDPAHYCTGAPGLGWTNYKRRGDGVWEQDGSRYHCPYGVPGSMLWVRETWALEDCGSDGERVVWQADRAAAWRSHVDDRYYLSSTYTPPRWRPSIFMPRWASRISLENVGVRVERVQDLSEEDASAEGFESRDDFADSWERHNATNGFGWAVNNRVWVVDFRRA